MGHSDRGGRGLTFGVGHRTDSAQECCDKCKALKEHEKGPCNSWTFCGLPVCWGLDSGWNHTFGECWLRHLEPDHAASPTLKDFGQRGKYTEEFRQKHMNVRPECADKSKPWACPPTHVAWTSGSFGSKTDSAEYQTGGGWGNMVITPVMA